jgi:hypothetical protein
VTIFWREWRGKIKEAGNMSIDLPHMLATGLVIFVVVWAVEHTGMLNGASKLKRALITFASLFVVLFLLNLIWPYGAGLP